MAQINLLAQSTIDQIAAGEVVERPSSVVKELVENAIDAGAAAVTVDIKEGGISFIRVTDNGCGIEKEQIEKAFLRHATSKIRSAEDLTTVQSLGFRGEALSSIAAVAEVELITKRDEDLTGIRYTRKGEEDPQMEEIGAPNGTTFMIRNLFFNVPVRKKFLKQAPTEGGYIADMMEHMALSRPEVSFKFINNGQTRFHTSGNGDLKEVIYRIYGRDVVNSLVNIEVANPEIGINLYGYLGKPELNRANRNFEFFFVNGRYIKSDLLSKGLEEGYKQFLMQHKFPFAVLQIEIDTTLVDVNVHPTKMEVRFTTENEIFNFLSENIKTVMRGKELISSTVLVNEVKSPPQSIKAPEPFEIRRMANVVVAEETEYKLQENSDNLQEKTKKMQETLQMSAIRRVFGNENAQNNIIKADNHILVERPVQMNIFEDNFLSEEARSKHQILGQVFGTYWIVSFGERLVFIDQHAAHEKVKYERLLKELSEKTIQSQMISPPIVLQLSGREETVLKERFEAFTSMGFEIEEFGENAYALRSVPADLYGCQEAELFHEILDELSEGTGSGIITVIDHKIASAACKAAVKGNSILSMEELEMLIEELLTLENPYHCPHGRPTMISMSQYEIEKKFKRIL